MENKAFKRIKEISALENKVIELEGKQREANQFIIEIAILLNIETDGIGYDDIQLTYDDFEKAINRLRT